MSVKITGFLKNKKGSLIIGLVIAFIGLYYFFWIFLSGDVFMPHSKNESNRQLLLKIRNEIKVGDVYEKVLQNFWSKKAAVQSLEINVPSAEEWSITMPSEFGATDWRMYIKFEEGKVVGYQIRTSDGGKPKDAPEDIGKLNE
jgi:hypothetical protein